MTYGRLISVVDKKLKKLIDSYKPNKDVLEAMERIELLVTVGPSASGKTTIMNKLASRSAHVHFVLDETSRRPRPGEEQAVDFLFRSREDILEDLERGDLVQAAVGPNGDLYCTRLTSYPQAGIGMIALVPAAVREFRKLPIKSIKTAFIVPKSYEAWQNWLRKQAKESGWSSEQQKQRLVEAEASYEFALSDKKASFVLNDTVSKAARRLQQVCRDEKPSDEKQARQIAQENYKRLTEAP